MTDAIRDDNHVTVALGVSSTDSTATLPFKIDSATGRLLTNSASGSGDVVGPASATDDAIATFDGTTGKLLQNTVVTIAQTTGVIAGTEGVTLSGTTSGTTAVIATAIAGSTTLTLPAATDTLVGKATTDTLTNKAIDQDGTGNSITNLANASIKAAAAIDLNKLAVLTASEIAISDSSGFIVSAAVATYPSLAELIHVKGVTSAIQTQLNAKGVGDLLADGSVSLSADWDAGSHKITAEQLESDIATGTAPLVVASTTVVANLQSATVATITGLAPDTATTQATQASITTCANLVTVGALDAGSITANFGTINNGASAITTTGVITGGTLEATGDTSAGDNSALGYTATEGAVLTGQGSTSDITIKNDADATILTVPTGSTNLKFGVDGTISNLILAEKASVQLDPAGGADGDYSGTTFTGTGGATIAFGELVYLKTADSEWYLADADAVGTAGTVSLAYAVSTSTDGNPVTLMKWGILRADAVFPALTIGAPVYAGVTPGAIQVAAPTGADDVVRVVGFALTANEISVEISPDHITVTG